MRRRNARAQHVVPLPMDSLRAAGSRGEYLDAVHAWADQHEEGGDANATIHALAYELAAFEVDGSECHQRVVGLARQLGAHA